MTKGDDPHAKAGIRPKNRKKLKKYIGPFGRSTPDAEEPALTGCE